MSYDSTSKRALNLLAHLGAVISRLAEQRQCLIKSSQKQTQFIGAYLLLSLSKPRSWCTASPPKMTSCWPLFYASRWLLASLKLFRLPMLLLLSSEDESILGCLCDQFLFVFLLDSKQSNSVPLLNLVAASRHLSNIRGSFELPHN